MKPKIFMFNSEPNTQNNVSTWYIHAYGVMKTNKKRIIHMNS